MAEPRTERGLDRLVNFSDATVAIAITLLILPLVDVATETRDHDLGTVFHENLGALISFVVTFAVIGQFWTVHHRIFEYVRAYSPRLIAANFVWGSDGQPSISALYIGTMVVVTAAAFGIDLILIRHPELCHPESVGDLSLAPSLSFITLLVVAGVIAVVFPAINLYALLILFLGRQTTKLYDRWLPRAAVGRRAGDAKAEEGATSE